MEMEMATSKFADHVLLINAQGEVADIAVQHKRAVQRRREGLRHSPVTLSTSPTHANQRYYPMGDTDDCGRAFGFHSCSVSDILLAGGL